MIITHFQVSISLAIIFNSTNRYIFTYIYILGERTELYSRKNVCNPDHPVMTDEEYEKEEEKRRTGEKKRLELESEIEI